jgi:pyruvate/2-oxoglutarate dehydrogenase complex dihydrolipoamide acyltransferase (E2) component
MAVEVRMPSLSPSMTEGSLARWLKKEGDAVDVGDALAEIETDKAVVEIEAPAAGLITRILKSQGAVVPMGAPIGLVRPLR